MCAVSQFWSETVVHWGTDNNNNKKSTALISRLIPLQCDQLQPGMFVAELDRSWLHTPFTGSGFLITQDMQIDELTRLCHYVYVDPAKSRDMSATDLGQAANDPEVSAAGLSANPDLVRARAVLDAAALAVAANMQSARRNKSIGWLSLDRSAKLILESVLSCPDALLWVVRTEFDPGYIYRRSVGSAIHAALLGKQIGLDKERIRQMVLGGLLLDIGKISVPIAILAKPGALNAAEKYFTERHVGHGYAIVRMAEHSSQRIVEMVLGHHERLDGSGYPRRLAGTEIPLFARMAGIIDTFDALTLNRRYAPAMSCHAALQLINSTRDHKFDAAITREFIHATGIYPTGSPVELSDGRSGIVCAQNPDAPRFPRVVITAGGRLQPLPTGCVLDSSRTIRISRALPPASLRFDRDRLNALLNAEVRAFR